MDIQPLINQIYATQNNDESLLQIHDRICTHVKEHISPNHVPHLTSNNYQRIKEGSLVRIDCMIQDIFDREMECLPTNAQKCPLYSLAQVVPENHSSAKSQYMDMDILYTVPIPALNEPRFAQDSSQEDEMTDDINEDSSTLHTSHRKRKRSNDSPTSLDQDSSLQMSTTQSPPQKKHQALPQKTRHPIIEDSSSSADTHALPLLSSNSPHMPCIVKMYHTDSHQHDESAACKLTAIITVLGILTHEPTYFPHPDDDKHSLFHQEELTARLPSSSLVPRLYALNVKAYDSVYALQREHTLSLQSSFNVESHTLAHHLVVYLAQGLNSDTLAAHYVALHLLSRTHRTRDSTIINKLSINIHGLQSADPIISLLQSITPALSHIPFEIETLNSTALYPVKNHEKNKLEDSLLQLPAGTHLVLNETSLSEGQVNEQALKNINALKQLITQQTLVYDYEFDTYNLPVDIPTLLVSRQKSLLHECVDVILPLASSEKHEERVDYSALLPQFRTLLMNREKPLLDFPDDVKQAAQQDFVRMRKDGAGTEGSLVTQLDLSRWINMARLLALLYQSPVTQDIWKEVIQMELQRKRRL